MISRVTSRNRAAGMYFGVLFACVTQSIISRANEEETDDADWLIGTKAPDETKFKQYFGNPNVVPCKGESVPACVHISACSAQISVHWRRCQVSRVQCHMEVVSDRLHSQRDCCYLRVNDFHNRRISACSPRCSMFKTEATKFEVCTRPLGGGDLENCEDVPSVSVKKRVYHTIYRFRTGSRRHQPCRSARNARRW